MNRPIAKATLPAPPGRPALGGSAPFLAWVGQLHDYFGNQRRTVTNQFADIIDQVNNAVQGVGDDLASGSGTIALTNAIHGVTGTGAIAVINPPDEFSGPVFLLVLDAWTLVTGGNIATAKNPVLNTTQIMIWSPRAKLWYPA